MVGGEDNIRALVDYLETEVKGEPPVEGNKGICGDCRYRNCRYCGLEEDRLPAWMSRYGRK